MEKDIGDARNFEWLSQMRFYFDPTTLNVLEQLKIRMANAEFHYGFEYLGIFWIRLFNLLLSIIFYYIRYTRSSRSNTINRSMFSNNDTSIKC